MFLKQYGRKYQGVKEFHMLACIGSYCKIMVFSPFRSHIITHARGKNDGAPPNLQKPLKCTIYMGITPPNMTHLTSNSLLSPTKSIVARDNQW